MGIGAQTKNSSGGFSLPLAALAFLCGIVALDSLPDLPAAWWLAALLPLALGVRHRGVRYLFIAALGFAWAWWPAYSGLQHRLPAALEGQDLTVVGVVQPFPRRQGQLVRIALAVTQIDAPAPLDLPPRKLRLNWYRPKTMPHAGEKWRFRVRLKRPNGFQDPGGFDYEGWLFANRFDATGYVRGDARRLDDGTGAGLVLRARRKLDAVIDAAVPGSAFTGVLQGVTVGDGHAIPARQWDVFRQTGIVHLVVISGSHIILVAGFAGLLISLLWRTSGRLCERLAARRAATLGGLVIAIGYALLAGFGIPIQRALLMFAVIAATVWYGGSIRPYAALAVGLIGVLLIDPLAPLAPGFWLSFGAVAVLIYVFAGRPARGWLHKTLWAQIAVLIGLLPLAALFFGHASSVGGIANLVAIPLFEFVIVPLALAGALLGTLWLPAGSLLLGAAAKVLAWLWPLLEWAAALPHAYVPVPEPSLWVLILALAGVALLLAPRGIPARWLGAVMIAPLALAPQPRPAPGGFNLTLLDVGQGLAAVVRTHAHTLIFDTGPSFASGSDTGALVVVPYLHSRGIVDPDLLIVSHGDDDHAGGVQSVLKAFPQLPVMTSARRRLPAAAPCVAGKHWRWDGVRFRMLNPATAAGDGSDNNRSCVLKIDAGGGSALLTGDIEAAAERRLVEHDARLLRSDILVAPHHGSATSSTAEFIQAVAPRYVLFPVGYRNRWHFPRPAVVARYRAAGARLFGTAACGAISFHVAAAVAFAGAWRTDHRHFWTRDGNACE